MPTQAIFPTEGLNLTMNPLLHKPGTLIRAVNVDSYYLGAKKKRPGYTQFISGTGALFGSAITQLWNWQKDDGTSSYLYAVSGGRVLYYDLNGTATDWTIAGNGTISSDRVGHAVLENTMILGDGVSSTRYSTDGTSFTDLGLAPIASDFVSYEDQRIYAVGTASTVFRSSVGDATNWSTSGTSTSDSFNIPGAGKGIKGSSLGGGVILQKNSGLQYRWDGYNLRQVPTSQGLSSVSSYDEVDGFGIYLNRNGIHVSSGGTPELISNAIEKQVYNDAGEGIAGSVFGTARAGVHRYDYFLSAGTVTDDLTNETINNAIIKYNFQRDEFLNFQFSDFPSAYVSYKDTSGVQKMLFADGSGNSYHYGGTATTDNGDPIESTIVGVFSGGTLLDKQFNKIRLLFNPGCEAKVQVAVSNTFQKQSLNWKALGDASSGVVEFDFGKDSRGALLFYKIHESSRNARFEWYGGEVDFDIIQ